MNLFIITAGKFAKPRKKNLKQSQANNLLNASLYFIKKS